MSAFLNRREASVFLQQRLYAMDFTSQLRSTNVNTHSSTLSPSVVDHKPTSEPGIRLRQNFGAYDPFPNRNLEQFGSQAVSIQPAMQSASDHFKQRASSDSLMQATSTSRASLTAYDMLSSTSPAFDAFCSREPNENMFEPRRQSSHSNDYEFTRNSRIPSSDSFTQEYDMEPSSSRVISSNRLQQRYHSRRRPFNQDEFDGPSQLLPPPFPQAVSHRAADIPSLPTNLNAHEQDNILSQTNAILSQCAFHFVAKYQFPIPIERDKPHVVTPSDRDWTEWAFYLRRLATKRRIPARVLYKNQIKHLVTILENSLDVRYPTRDLEARALKDDRNVLQLISAATQVAKILMDSLAMQQLDELYVRTETTVQQRRTRRLQY